MPRALRNWKPKEKLIFSAVKSNPHNKKIKIKNKKFNNAQKKKKNTLVYTQNSRSKIKGGYCKKKKKVKSHQKFFTRPNSPRRSVLFSATSSSFNVSFLFTMLVVVTIASHSHPRFRWRSPPNRNANSERLDFERVTLSAYTLTLRLLRRDCEAHSRDAQHTLSSSKL